MMKLCRHDIIFFFLLTHAIVVPSSATASSSNASWSDPFSNSKTLENGDEAPSSPLSSSLSSSSPPLLQPQPQPLHRRLTPDAHSLELMETARNTHWHRELTAAADVLSRRRERQRQRQRRRNVKERDPIDAVGASASLRTLQSSDKGSKYNSYLPQQSPLDAVDDDSNHNNVDEDSDVDSDECLSPLQRWFLSLLDSIGSDTWEDLQTYNVTTLAYLYKHYVSTADGTEEYFGTYGDRTLEMKVNHQKMVDFWSVSQLGDDSDAEDGSGDADADADTDAVVYTENAAFSFSDPNNPDASDNESSSSSSSSSSSAPAANVILLGMHGVDIADDAKLFPTLQRIYHLDIATTKQLGDKIQSIVATLPGAFNNPILTANAVAIQSADNNLQNAHTYNGQVVQRNERDSIVVGDGVFHFLEWLGLEKDGMDYIHSHEFGHHVQYEMGVGSLTSAGDADADADATVFYDDERSLAERTRRLELMADSFGSYYLGHARGGRLDAARLAQIHQTAFSLGDCQIDAAATHHGTPRQRECASNYGSQLAVASYVDGGYVVGPEELMGLFEETLDGILRLDDGICEWVVDSAALDENIYGDMYAIFEEKYLNGGGGSGIGSGYESVGESASASQPESESDNGQNEDTNGSSNVENVGIGDGYFTTSSASAPSSASDSGKDGYWFDWNPPDESSSSSSSSSSTSQQTDPWGQEQSWEQESQQQQQQQQWETYPTESTNNPESTLDYPPPIIDEDEAGNDDGSEAGWFEKSKWGDGSTTYYRTTSGGVGILPTGLCSLMMSLGTLWLRI